MNGVLSIEVYGYAAPVAYTVALKSSTEDATNWQGKAGTGDYQSMPLTGLEASTAVSVKYSGTKMVKSVKAVKKAAAPSVPDGAINGKFSVSDTKQVYFSKGNLRYASGTWSFFDNQYDYYTSYSADAWDKFGWSTSATTYGMNTSTDNATYSGDFVDWGATMGTGWFTLSSDEWTYLLNTRTSGGTVFGTSSARYAHATINTDGTGVNGMILFPDGVDIASTEVTTAGTVNNTSAYATKCTTAQWSVLAAKGCVFLPAAGFRGQASVNGAGSYGYYWSSSPYTSDANRAYLVFFSSGTLNPASYSNRNVGYSVRLVQATSDAAPAYDETKSINDGAVTVAAGEHWLITGTGEATTNIIIIENNATVTLSGVNITAWDRSITCEGNATIILADGTTNNLYPAQGEYGAAGIEMRGGSGTSLTIQGNTGVLNITSGSGPAIGAGYDYAGCAINIEGGIINATSTDGPGIGAGYETACGNITISGGTVAATGGNGCPGIGGASSANCGDITITSNVTSVTATKGSEAPYSIGASSSGSCGTVTIGGVVGAITESPFTYPAAGL